jgi:hypothetical protein
MLNKDRLADREVHRAGDSGADRVRESRKLQFEKGVVSVVINPGDSRRNLRVQGSRADMNLFGPDQEFA